MPPALAERFIKDMKEPVAREMGWTPEMQRIMEGRPGKDGFPPAPDEMRVAVQLNEAIQRRLAEMAKQHVDQQYDSFVAQEMNKLLQTGGVRPPAPRTGGKAPAGPNVNGIGPRPASTLKGLD